MSKLGLVIPALLAFLVAPEVRAETAQSIQKGMLVEKVTCAADPKQSYALYLPSGYTGDKKWPILYCFDPSAVGSAPVANFKDGAEEYGYIVAGSNNSQNGPGNLARDAIVAMWDDTHSRFKIDDSRVYATGFSGGARVAIGFGYAFEGKVAGVIACGAGFPPNIVPSRSTPFAVFATVGVEDFNYPELVRLRTALDAAGIPNRLRCFDGQHQWAPKEICTESIEWMQIQAMKSGTLEKNGALIDKLFAKATAAAGTYESSSKPYDAFVSYEALAADFKGLKDVTEFEKKAASLKDSKEVKQALKQEKEQVDKQLSKEKELRSFKATIMSVSPGNDGEPGSEAQRGDAGVGRTLATAEDRDLARADLKKAIAALRKKGAEETASSDRVVARRVLQGFYVECYEIAESLIRARSYPLAAAHLEIAAEIRPDRSGIQYRLACAYSLTRQKSKALEALKKAVEKGFADLHALESNPELEGIRADPAFRQVLDNLKAKKQT